MKAVRFDHPGSPDVVNIIAVDDLPNPGPDEVLVEVKRMALNGADLKTLAGWFPGLPYPRGLGREFSGAVRKVGENVSTVTNGSRVLGITEPAMQEYVLVTSDQVMPIPQHLSYDVACTLPVAAQTAWAAVESQNVQPGNVCIVGGASGGVGSVIVQLLLEKGATVVALAREHHHERLEIIGALPVGWGDDLVDTIREFTPQGIHHVFDQVGPVVIEAALALGVPHSQINCVSGYAEMFGVAGVGRVGLNEDTIERLAKMIVDGSLVIPTITLPLEDIAQALTSLKIGSHYGKTVMSTEIVDDEAMADHLLSGAE